MCYSTQKKRMCHPRAVLPLLAAFGPVLRTASQTGIAQTECIPYEGGPMFVSKFQRPASSPSRSLIGVSRLAHVRSWSGCGTAFVFALLVTASSAQETNRTSRPPESPSVNTQLPVNWLYGAYIPKGIPLVALNGQQRVKLYIRQTFTTPGIYIKSGLFAVHDQVNNTPSEWGDGLSGFAERIGSNQATNIIQNSFTSLGQGIVGWEPRYDRCRCTGGWRRLVTRSLETS